MVYESNSWEDTFNLGKRLGEAARAGQVYCLDGDLGVGKTVFTQGFAQGLGIEEPVGSPTFTIVQQYDEGRMPLWHFDVYRIGDISEMDEIGWEDCFYGEGVCWWNGPHGLRTCCRRTLCVSPLKKTWSGGSTTGALKS